MQIEIPCEIGQFVYTIDSINQHLDNIFDYYPTKEYNGETLVIKEHVVEGFIIDGDGVTAAECSHDGWNKLTVYQTYCDMKNKYDFEQIFYNKQDAIDFLNDIE